MAETNYYGVQPNNVRDVENRYRYTANASQTAFPANYAIGYVDVYYGGVKLDPGTAFSAVNGTSVTLSNPATAGITVEIISRRQVPVTTGVALPSVATSSYTATAGQTVFTLSTGVYTPGSGSLVVYMNGLKLRTGTDYLESSTTTFTLVSGAALGDELDCIVGTLVSPNNGFNSGLAPVMELYTATAGQTAFSTVNAYTPAINTLDVYVNGISYNLGVDYVETSSNLVTFTMGLSLGDEVKFKIWRTSLTSGSDASIVTYSPAGTGALGTTVQEKNRESLSVFDFISPSLHTLIQARTYIGDLSTQIMAADAAAVVLGKRLFFPAGLYKCNVTLTGYFSWYGEGQSKTTLQAYSSSVPVIKDLFQEPNWRFTSISQMGLLGLGINYDSGSGTPVGIGFSYGDPTTYTTNQELIGRVVFNQVAFVGFNKGVSKCYGNIGNTYNQCSFQYNNYGTWAIDAKTATAGVSTAMQPDLDTFNGGEFHSNNLAAACYLGYNITFGGLSFNQTVMQVNNGYGVYISAPSCALQTPENFNVWFEANGLSANVTLDYITPAGAKSTQTVVPSSFYCPDLFGYNFWSGTAGNNGIGTSAPNAPLGIWGMQRTALNLIAGGYAGTKYTQIAFSDVGTEGTAGALIRSTTTTGLSKDLLFTTGASSANPLYLAAGLGSVKIGTDAYSYATGVVDGSHAIYGASSLGAGGVLLTLGTRFANPTEFAVSDGTVGNAALCSFRLAKVNSTGRSVNAGGTVNTAGADYAEYENNNGLVITKGSLVGFKADGTLTLTFSEAVRFGIKSTNPSFVGGDSWHNSVGVRPTEPQRKFDVFNETLVTPASDWIIEEGKVLQRAKPAVFESVLSEPGDTDAEWAAIQVAHANAIAAFDAALELERAKVDRIAYSGKVPCNVTGATPGGYIIAVASTDGSIAGQFVADPDFTQYKKAVGRVNRITSDGCCEVAIIVH